MTLKTRWYFFKRKVRNLYFKVWRGFGDNETWSLSSTIAEFALPRLKRYKEVNCTFPGGEITEEKWDEILDDMIFALNICVREGDGSHFKDDTIDWERVQRGLELFGKHFRELWW